MYIFFIGKNNKLIKINKKGASILK